MKNLPCPKELCLGSSATQMITWNYKNLSEQEFIDNLVFRLTDRCKTIPYKYGIRTASLLGLIYDQFNGHPQLLDIVIKAINKSSESIN